MVDGPTAVSWPEANSQSTTLFAHTLVGLGVQHVVLSPGSRSTPLVLAFDACAELTLHAVLDERSAAFFALGMARASGRPVVVLCTSGSAGAHHLPAVIEADQTGVPLLVITADRPPELHHCGAAQTIPQQTLFGERVRFFADVGAPTPGVDPYHVRTVAMIAVQRATGAKPGPVHLNWAFREPLWDPAGMVPAQSHPQPMLMQGELRLPQEQIIRLSQQLRSSMRGIIVCGPNPPQASSGAYATQIHRLAAYLGWPILAEATSQVRFGRWEDEHATVACDSTPASTSGSVITTYDALLRDPAFAAAHQPDCILRFGQTPTSKALNAWLAHCQMANTVLIHPHGKWCDPNHRAVTMVVGDVAGVCADVLTYLRAQDHALQSQSDGMETAPLRHDAFMHTMRQQWRDAWQRADHVAHTRIARDCVVDGMNADADAPLWEGAIARCIVQVLRDGEALHVASSMPIRDVDCFGLTSSQQIAVYSSRGANGIDGTLSTALGEAMGAQTPLVLLSGDLAFLHDLGGLSIAAQQTQQHVRVVVVVINNGGGGIFGFLPIAQHATAFEPYFRTAQDHADIGAVCAALGVSHSVVNSIETLASAVRMGLQAGGVRVVEIKTDSALNMQRHQHAWRNVQQALRAAQIV